MNRRNLEMRSPEETEMTKHGLGPKSKGLVEVKLMFVDESSQLLFYKIAKDNCKSNDTLVKILCSISLCKPNSRKLVKLLQNSLTFIEVKRIRTSV